MIHKHISVFALTLLGVAAGFAQVNLNPVPSRTVGHPVTPILEQNSLYSGNPNLVEGRELFQPRGVVVDTSTTPSPVYVSDFGNNRVLGWRSVASLSNGQKADIVIGQNDFFTTHGQGPGVAPRAPNQGSPLQAGLSGPTGLAVRNGDLYIVDSGNNRVLRFPKPFSNPDRIPDMVIGQPGLSSRTPNFGGSQPTAQGLNFASGNSVLPANIAFDAEGNLWVVDPGNRRVLRFANADIEKSPSYGPTANLQIGQFDFRSLKTNLSPYTASNLTIKDQFSVPAGIAFDRQGRLYVSDSDPARPDLLSRVLVFSPPFENGEVASRIMGVTFAGQSRAQIFATQLSDPGTIFVLPDDRGLGVVDSGDSRILIFPAYEQWMAETLQYSPQAVSVVGHGHATDFESVRPNNSDQSHLKPPSSTVLNGPASAFFAGNDLYIADTYNNRVLVMPYQALTPPTFGAATRVLGQDRLDAGSINLVEGREFQFLTATSSGNLLDSGIAVDNTSDPPRLYVADPGNNRILGYRDARRLAAGMPADIVIGQPDMQTGICNWDSNGNSAAPAARSLCSPVGVLVDSRGDLWVADRGNGRVLRYPTPFSQSGRVTPNLVLGQATFESRFTDATASTMGSPYGLGITINGALLVSDQAHNRVLVFEPTGGNFSNGQAASMVIGQHDFRSTAAGTDSTSLNGPHHIAVDTDSRLYVADTANNRIMIFDSLNKLPATDATAAHRILSLNGPEGIYVSPVTGEIWVANTGSSQAIRYPRYDQLLVGGQSNFTIGMPSASLAVAQDAFGALAVADATSRIAFYFPRMAAQNGANFLSTDARPLAPGTAATLYPFVGQFTTETKDFTSRQPYYPLPTELADVQVLFNNAPAPLYFVSPDQINFYVPMNAPTSGNADVQVVRKSSGQVLGAARIPMATVAPALFLNPVGQTGTSRQVAVINVDNGQPNGPGNPAKRGSWVLIYGTGQGFIPGAPNDGSAAPDSPLFRSASDPRILLGGCFMDDQGCTKETGNIYYSGLAPGFVGLWQINLRIPQNTAVVDANYNQVPLVVVLDSVFNTDSTSGYRTTIAIEKP